MTNNDTNPSQEHAAWCEQRLGGLRSSHGNIALVDYISVKDTVRVDCIDARVTREGDGVRLFAGPDVTVDGQPVDGDVFVGTLRPDGTPLIRRGDITIDVFTLDGTDYELRVYDAHAEKLDNFAGLDVYDYDPDMVIYATFEAYPENQHVPWDFTRSTDTGHSKKVPGVVAVEIDGERYELVAFLDGETLVLTFADATTGPESYAPGRFLRLPSPAADGTLQIDFNYSFIPPCGFSTFYSCPLPPPQNRIGAPIRAGEKKVLWHKDPYDD